MASLSFGQIEAVLAKSHGIAEHKRTAFSGRLRFLQKNGLPIGVLQIRGKPTEYNFCHALQMAMGANLLHAGLSPNLAAKIVVASWDLAIFTTNHCLSTLEVASSVELHIRTADVLMACRLSEMSDLTDQVFPDEAPRMEPFSPLQLVGLLSNAVYISGLTGQAAWIVIQFAELLQGLVAELMESGYAKLEDIREDVGTEVQSLLTEQFEGAHEYDAELPPWDDSFIEWYDNRKSISHLQAEADKILSRGPRAIKAFLTTLRDEESLHDAVADMSVFRLMNDFGLVQVRGKRRVLSRLGQVAYQIAGGSHVDPEA